MATDDWGGIAVDNNTDDWGGVLVEESKPIPENAISTMGIGTEQKDESFQEPSLSERYEDVKKKAVGRIESVMNYGNDNPAMKLFLPSIVIGQAAGTINDVTSEAIAALTPNKVKQWATDVIKENVGEPNVVGFIIDSLGKGQKGWGKVQEKYPNYAKLIESNMNVAALAMYGKGGPKATKKLAEEFVDTTGDTLRLISRATPQKAEHIIQQEVTTAAEKAIRPNLSKASALERKNFFRDFKDAATDIVQNKNNIELLDKFGNPTNKLPETAEEFQSALWQRKGQLFEQWDEITKNVNGKINTKSIQNKLENFAKDKKIKYLPEVERYALEKKQILEDIGDYTAKEVQDAMETLNLSIGEFNKSRSAVAWGKVKVDFLVKQELEKLLYEKMGSLKGDQFRSLRLKYRNIKTIEKDVNRAVNRIANKAENNIVDVGTDVFTSYHALASIINMNPPQFAAASGAKIVKDIHKAIIDPNRKIKQLFKLLESTANKKEFIPKSTLGKAAKFMTQETENYTPNM